MVQINFAHKEIQCKIVYYGPGMSGKTTNLELVHEKTPGDSRGELTSIATTGERTLYFDYMPLDLGAIAGIRTKFQLYTVPGQIYYKSTRRLVLQGVDGIVFVADSSAAKLEENRESMRDLEENLREMGRSLTDLPIVVQYNKRDLPDAMSIEDLQRQVNVHAFPYFEAIAPQGQGVFPTLKALASLVLEAVNRGGIGATRAPRAPAPGAAAPATAGAPAVGAAAGSGSGAPATSTAPAPTHRPTTRVAGDEPAPRIAASGDLARSAPSRGPSPGQQSGAEAVEEAGGVAVATRPSPAPSKGRTPPAPSAAPAPASAPVASTITQRSVSDRMVTVSGLGRPSGGGRAAAILGLLALIGAAAWFVLTRLGK